MNSELWQRLQDFDLDEAGVAFCFTDRLARENGWSREFARRVVEEYKRFLFLAVEAGHPVTPSDEVDQAWHLYLCYTRSYWEDLCEGVLGRKIHHGPTKGGDAEGRKFDDWYDWTLASYRRIFGEEPPADLWPEAVVRFRPAEFRRVDVREAWVLPKRVAVAAVAVGLLSLVAVGCSDADEDPGSWIVLIIMVAAILSIMVRASSMKGGRHGRGDKRRKRGDRDGGGWFGGCSGCSGCGSSGCSSSGCGGGGCGGGGCGGCGGGD